MLEKYLPNENEKREERERDRERERETERQKERKEGRKEGKESKPRRQDNSPSVVKKESSIHVT